MIFLKSSDGETFEVEESVMVELLTIKHMIENNCADDPIHIPIPNVTSPRLAKVIEYCKRHFTADGTTAIDEDLKLFDDDFVKVDRGTLYDLVRAANELKIKSLLELISQTSTDIILEKIQQEIRKAFRMTEDHNADAEEEEENLSEETGYSSDVEVLYVGIDFDWLGQIYCIE
ncbi:unnamed protein product [Fraxinus pennsylvanica]|uniref:SKP1-like protein n=1 Tax=Fraxinus pennsylvanica TaxID=56036 RepID=A0AAD2DQC5_9LAMI|nr:unnamed protein product [Fraxinus pennsylvanica]